MSTQIFWWSYRSAATNVHVLVYIYNMFAELIQSKTKISTKVVSQLIINQLFNITVKQTIKINKWWLYNESNRLPVNFNKN